MLVWQKSKNVEIFLPVWHKPKDVQRKEAIFETFSYSKPSVFFRVSTTFFRSFKKKNNNIISNYSSSNLISAKQILCSNYHKYCAWRCNRWSANGESTLKDQCFFCFIITNSKLTVERITFKMCLFYWFMQWLSIY